MKSRRESGFNVKLICNIRARTNKSFKSQNIEKTNKTIDLIGCSNFFKENGLFINFMVK